MSEGKTPEELKELGNKAFANQKYDEAIKLYTDAIKLDGNNHVFFSNRSASHGGKGDWKASAEDAKECIRLDPSFIKGYYRLAAAQMELKDFDAALATIRQGLALDKDNSQLLKQMRTVKHLKKESQKTPNDNLQAADSGGRMVTGGGKALDAATQREFQDLQLQYAQANREFNTVNANTVKTQREYHINELTKQELEGLPPDANCYRSIGKMFMKSSKPGVMEHLEKRMEEQKKKEADMTQKLEYLERRIKSTQKNMEELMSSS
ncbi:Stress-induced-phosphoprotein 1 [Seminavis robusta]|uniref:Hsp70-Hsp90 organising protein n=1 Tax=Seminavis robusta TaxID=568900 RepID=A0A9N8HQR1_9STRA|nr:Stress-induced-phosphoprotein 1 [Seminavis robusta]|eukprot:Sro1473_g275620.1 Stress-induced-phosphoprotein 1 (265) ;mRNA; r:14036-14935